MNKKKFSGCISCKTDKGITLSVLVITIIVLLILAGITISLLTNSKLVDKAKLAKESYENASDKELEMLNGYNDQIDEEILGAKKLELKDYKENLLYQLDLNNISNGVNGVSITSSGVDISNNKKYITFDGTGHIKVDSNVVDTNNELVGTTDKSICFWYRTNTTENRRILWYGSGYVKGGSTLFHFLDSTGLRAGVGARACDCDLYPSSLKDGEWHFVCGSWSSGNTITMYYDSASFKVIGNYSTEANTNSTGLLIGKGTDGDSFIGDLADIRIYTSALTQSQVRQLYFYGLNNLQN